MLADNTTAGSLFKFNSLQQKIPQVHSPPPPPRSLVYNKIWFIKDIDITLRSIFI